MLARCELGIAGVHELGRIAAQAGDDAERQGHGDFGIPFGGVQPLDFVRDAFGHLKAIAVDTLSLDFGQSPDFIVHNTWLPAGRYGFAMENIGVEEHEMVLFRRNDGVTGSFEELAELGDAMMEKVTFTGVAFGGPDTTSYAAVDLEPGTYFLVCFVPVGGGEDGAPHFMEGMQTTVEVV